ncbi:MAG: hypothetical protein AB7L17_22135 [Ilumatobacteraceae bacterium]|jgi:hypothetical protein
MLSRTVTRAIMAVAIVCATVAWSGWAYLNTAASPHRVEDVADAVVADPEARFELAGPLADQIVESTALDPAFTPQIRAAVADTLADPRVSANISDAFGSLHSRAVGVDDERPTTIDGATLVAALRDHLATVDPALAALIPDGAVPDLHLPDVHPPFVASLRSIAVTCTNWLAGLAVLLFAAALIVGDRRYALRRYGIWAIVTGLLWAIGPRILVLLAHRWTPDSDATIAAAVGAATKVMTAAATALVASGVVAIVVAQFAGLGQRYVDAPPPTAAPAPARAQPARVAAVPAHAAPARPAPAPRQPARPAPADVYEPGWVHTSQHPLAPPVPAHAAATTVMRPDGWGVGQFTAPAPEPVPADDDVDPWAHFSGPAVRPDNLR